MIEGRLARPFSFHRATTRSGVSDAERGERECLKGISPTGCSRPSRASVPTWSWASTRNTGRCPRRCWPRIRGASTPDEAEMKVACYREFLAALLPALADEACGGEDPDRLLRGSGRAGYALYEEMVGLAKSLGYSSSPTSSGATSAARPRPTPGPTSMWPARTPSPSTPISAPTGWSRSSGAPGSGQGRVRAGEDLQPQFRRDPGRAARVGRAGLRPRGRPGGRMGPGRGGRAGYSRSGRWWAGRIPSRGPGCASGLPGVPFLIPGYGAQGATAADLAALFDAGRHGGGGQLGAGDPLRLQEGSGPALAGRGARRGGGHEGRPLGGSRPWVGATTYLRGAGSGAVAAGARCCRCWCSSWRSPS